MTSGLGSTDFYFSEWILPVAKFVVNVGGRLGGFAADAHLHLFTQRVDRLRGGQLLG